MVKKGQKQRQKVKARESTKMMKRRKEESKEKMMIKMMKKIENWKENFVLLQRKPSSQIVITINRAVERSRKINPLEKENQQ